MKLDRILSLFDDPGPFASAYVEVSRADTDNKEAIDLTARAAHDELVELGAPAEVADQVRVRLATVAHWPAPVSRCVVASGRGILLDELTAVHRAQPQYAFGPLPDLAQWLQDASIGVPYVLALVDHAGGRVQTFADGGPGADVEAEITDDSPYLQQVWASNAGEVVEEIRRQLAGGPDLLVLAGDVQSRQLVEGELDLGAEVVQLEHGGRAEDGGDAALADEIREVLRGRLITSRLERLHELGQQLGRGDRMAAGIPAGTEHLFGTPVATVLRWD